MEYSSSFTASGILYNEFEAVLPLVAEANVKDLLAIEIKENKLLKLPTEQSRKLIVTELKKRLDAAGNKFLPAYQNSSSEERKLLLFYLCVKTYQLVWDFHFKVTIPGYWAYRHEVDNYAYKMYLDELSSNDEGVARWSEATRKKCISNYIRMLNEAGLNQAKLTKPNVTESFYCFFLKLGETWALDIYFLSKQEKETIANYCQ